MTTRVRRRTCAISIALALACISASCGVGSEQQAHVFSAGEVPSGILDRSFAPSTSSVGTTTAPEPMTAYRLFFVQNQKLYEVKRTSVGVPTLADVIDALAQGPTPSEIAAQFRSALGSTSVVSSVRANGALAEVDLSRSFNEIPKSDQLLAIGQITLTLADRPDVLSVKFTQLNLTIDVPKGDSSLTHEPVGADDYRALVSLPTGPTTTSVGANPAGGTGPAGGSGPAGTAAASGPNGSPGPTGASGSTGVSGSTGANGAPAASGATGP